MLLHIVFRCDQVNLFLRKFGKDSGREFTGISTAATNLLLSHYWPGNVRELENVLSSACITTAGDFIDLGDLPEHLQHRGPRSSEEDDWKPLSLDEVRKVHIRRVLGLCQGNRLKAAQFLGIGRTSLYRYLKRDGVDTRKTKSGGASA